MLVTSEAKVGTYKIMLVTSEDKLGTPTVTYPTYS